MKFLDVLATILVIIGALNWGLVGLFNYNLVTSIFGFTMLSKLIFIIVGISGVWMIFSLMRKKS